MCQCEMVLGPFAARKVGTNGHEIVSPDGAVIAWAATKTVAIKLVALLNLAHGAGLIE